MLDRKWREHLYEMDYLQRGIGLRAMAQRDPLVEYQREGFDLFAAMMDGIKEESVGYLFHVEVQVEEQQQPAPSAVAPSQEMPFEVAPGVAAPQVSAKGLGPSRPARLEYTAPSVDGGTAGVVRQQSATVTATPDLEYAGTARNAACPCGSGKKYKRCHGDPRRVV